MTMRRSIRAGEDSDGQAEPSGGDFRKDSLEIWGGRLLFVAVTHGVGRPGAEAGFTSWAGRGRLSQESYKGKHYTAPI